MATVGGITVNILRGGIRDTKERVRTWEVMGIPSLGSQLLGRGGGRWAYTAIGYDQLATLLSWFASLEALAGTIISITDDFGTVQSNCLVLNVGERIKQFVHRNGTSMVRGEIAIAGRFTV